MKRLDDARILMYSHDTFGLGHLRRSRAIAHALVDRFKGLNILILSGSQIAGAFDFKARVDFVKVPSVIKLYSGEYTSVSDHIDIADTLAMRESLIRKTAKLFDPDIFIVDKEPMGLKGEIESTLEMLRERGCKTVLGLRDVMDAPHLLEEEWRKKEVMDKIAALYDDIWIYGPADFYNPLTGLDVPQSVTDRLTYTGFLERDMPATEKALPLHIAPGTILVTAGGGGDGADIMAMVLAACEHDPSLTTPMLLVCGPFMAAEQRDEIHARAAKLSQVEVLDFDNTMEAILERVSAVVGMCGYNTFCEILSFDKPTLFVPRTHPRQEQLIRANRSAELGLTQVIDADTAQDVNQMVRALHALPQAAAPSQAAGEIDLGGLDAVCDRVELLLSGAGA
ncbi:glycosyltransferase family protein [Ahrensia sp. R2A130]|uniref:glycosyltransferase family protein n=1 Tax=Ahrensia sp. R2A130 TaxID=744979 RepID=UPI0001E0F118|nr:glycosyltransferase [Ahrensia sp. R2A130]EFL88061.1 membrane-anchored protein [Ahrensia sp. R2A130]